jgi:hypothetical protein
MHKFIGENFLMGVFLMGLASPLAAAPMVQRCSIFNDDAIFNTKINDIKMFPPRPETDRWISLVGSSVRLKPDLGLNENAENWQEYFGIPFNIMSTAAYLDWKPVNFDILDPRAGNGYGVPEESDCAASPGDLASVMRCDLLAPDKKLFPFPRDTILAEYGSCNDPEVCGDRHIIVVDAENCRLWESYFTYYIDSQWYAYTTATWDLTSNKMRPQGWSSGDAAGLPIYPFLLKQSEAFLGRIDHALRVTLDRDHLSSRYEWPASHRIRGFNDSGIPLGAILRLKQDFPIPDSWSTESKAIALALKEYGAYVADAGSNFFIQGEPNAKWTSRIFSELRNISMANMEFVDISAITSNPDFSNQTYTIPGSDADIFISRYPFPDEFLNSNNTQIRISFKAGIDYQKIHYLLTDADTGEPVFNSTSYMSSLNQAIHTTITPTSRLEHNKRYKITLTNITYNDTSIDDQFWVFTYRDIYQQNASTSTSTSTSIGVSSSASSHSAAGEVMTLSSRALSSSSSSASSRNPLAGAFDGSALLVSFLLLLLQSVRRVFQQPGFTGKGGEGRAQKSEIDR